MDSQRGAVRAAYSSSLRHYSFWKIIGPILEASPGIVETSQTSDFTFHQGSKIQSIEVIFLTPSSLEPLRKQETVSRLRQFTTLVPSSSSQPAIGFLLSEEAFTSASGKHSLNGLLALQVFLFENLTNPLPVIPIPDGPSLFTSLQEYMANLETIPVANPSPGDSVALLAHATSGPVTLCEQTTYILSDLYPSFKALSKAARVGEGQDMLVDYLGEEQAGRIFKFWREDVLR